MPNSDLGSTGPGSRPPDGGLTSDGGATGAVAVEATRRNVGAIDHLVLA